VHAKPRLLIVITLAEIGGAQSYVRDLIPELVGRYDVTVAAHGPGPLADAVKTRGADYVELRHVRRDVGPRDILGLFELWRLCRRLRPDIVHLNSSKVGVLGRIAGAAARVPVRVFTAHGWAFYASSGLVGRLYLWADRIVLPLTTAVICVSDTDREAGLAARTCVDERTWVIHNGVEPGPEPIRTVRPRVRIVSVGRLAAQKDFPALVRAAAALDPARAEVVVLGDGPDRQQIEADIARLEIADRFTLAGEVSDVPERLRDADVFVLASNFEGLPISVLEAMAAGLPIVASNVGGLPEMVEEGANGMLVPAGDSDGLARALEALVDDPALRRRQGEQSRRRLVESFSIDACRTAHLDLYARLLPAAGVAPPPASS
jgi:glycosyltransferase involved in cell wall biosynthesis